MVPYSPKSNGRTKSRLSLNLKSWSNMKRIIGIILVFIGIVAMATSLIFALYDRHPLAAVSVGGWFLVVIGIIAYELNE